MPALSNRQYDLLRHFRTAQDKDREFAERNPYYDGEFKEGWRRPGELPTPNGFQAPNKSECVVLQKLGMLKGNDQHYGKGTWFQLNAGGRAALKRHEDRDALPTLRFVDRQGK